MQGIADREINQILKEVGDEWAHLMRVPQLVLKTRNNIEIARLIVDNRDWTPAEMEEYERERDPKLVDNEGTELEIFDGQWRYKTVINSRELTDTELDDAPNKRSYHGASS